jgi:hypothetical protein
MQVIMITIRSLSWRVHKYNSGIKRKVQSNVSRSGSVNLASILPDKTLNSHRTNIKA